jgi:hypothetical protein
MQENPGISAALACAAALMVLGLLTMMKWRPSGVNSPIVYGAEHIAPSHS